MRGLECGTTNGGFRPVVIIYAHDLVCRGITFHLVLRWPLANDSGTTREASIGSRTSRVPGPCMWGPESCEVLPVFQLDKGTWPTINGYIGVPHLVGSIVACHLVQAHGI